MDYRFSPRPQNKTALWLTIALGASSLAFLGLGMGNVLSARTLWHFLFLLLTVATLFLFLRYFSSSYLYLITEEWGEPTLVIYHRQGKRLSVQCRLGLSHLLRKVEVADEKSEEGIRAMQDFRAERVRYSYLATLGNVPTTLLYGREGGVRFAIRLEYDAAFAEALSGAIERAEAYRTLLDEEEGGEND